jgi:nitrogen regulatory protein PII
VIIGTARTGEIGYIKIFINTVDKVTRVSNTATGIEF